MGLRPYSEGRRGLVRGTLQALEECELPERMKEGRNGVRSRAAARRGKAAEAGSGVGARRGCSSPSAAGGSGRAVGSATPPGGGGPPGRRLGTGRPRCWPNGGGAARLRMGWEPRPQAAEGAGARAEPELRHPGASEHLRAAPRARGGCSAGRRAGGGPGRGGAGSSRGAPGHVGLGSALPRAPRGGGWRAVFSREGREPAEHARRSDSAGRRE